MNTLRDVTILILATILVAFSQANAADSKSIDFTVVLKDLDGKPITQQKEVNGPQVGLTLGDTTINAINASLPEDQNLTGVVKFERFELMRKVYKNKSATLTPAEVTIIKERISKLYSPLVIGAAYELLDKK